MESKAIALTNDTQIRPLESFGTLPPLNLGKQKTTNSVSHSEKLELIGFSTLDELGCSTRILSNIFLLRD